MLACIYSVFVLSCVQVMALQQPDPPSKKSYRLCKSSRNWKSSQGITKGCRAIDHRISVFICTLLSLNKQLLQVCAKIYSTETRVRLFISVLYILAHTVFLREPG
jgi:hypothetical protein